MAIPREFKAKLQLKHPLGLITKFKEISQAQIVSSGFQIDPNLHRQTLLTFTLLEVNGSVMHVKH